MKIVYAIGSNVVPMILAVSCFNSNDLKTPKRNRDYFEGVSFKLTSSWPPARERGVARCGPDAASAGLPGEFREARFYAQAL